MGISTTIDKVVSEPTVSRTGKTVTDADLTELVERVLDELDAMVVEPMTERLTMVAALVAETLDAPTWKLYSHTDLVALDARRGPSGDPANSLMAEGYDPQARAWFVEVDTDEATHHFVGANALFISLVQAALSFPRPARMPSA